MGTSSHVALASLALLKALHEHGKDYIDSFVPFVGHCLSSNPADQVALPDLQTSLLATFGMTIPAGALKTILRRATRPPYSFIERIDKIYHIRRDKLKDSNLDSRIRENEANGNRLIDAFVAFAKDAHNLSLDTRIAEDAIFSYIGDHSLLVLQDPNSVPIGTAPSAPTPQIGFVAAQFIYQTLTTSSSPWAPAIESIAKGGILCDGLYFSEPSNVGRHLDKLMVCFDTPFLLRALGLTSAERQAPCTDLIRLLIQLDAKMHYFPHTLVEVRNVLLATSKTLRGSAARYMPVRLDVLDYCINGNMSASDIELFNAKLELELRRLRVYPLDTPPFEPEFVVEEAQLGKLLNEKIHYSNPDAMTRDLNSLTAIHRLRSGVQASAIENAKAVFVTTNYTLSSVSAEFFKERIRGLVIPHCLPDDVLCAIAWLKIPGKVPDLPRKRLIADCLAAMNPSEALWDTFEKEVNKQLQQGKISNDDYYLLRFSTASRTALVDATCGDPDVFTEGTIQAVLEQARRSAAGKMMAQLDEAQMARGDAEKALTDLSNARLREQKRLAELAARISGYLGKGMFALVSTVVLIALIVAFPVSKPIGVGSWIARAVQVASAIVIVLSWFNYVFGSTVKGWVGRLELAIEQRLLDLLLNGDKDMRRRSE